MIFQLNSRHDIFYTKFKKKQGNILQSSSGTDGGMYHWGTPVMYHVTLCEELR
jgi:hypothetical protein